MASRGCVGPAAWAEPTPDSGHGLSPREGAVSEPGLRGTLPRRASQLAEPREQVLPGLSRISKGLVVMPGAAWRGPEGSASNWGRGEGPTGPCHLLLLGTS